mmetsp:Transcript_30498/g.87479  ORF Transcript_30498/g.87479 Transcript_30498/m.87479 type:complete len:207 (-) Transcript_30498:34-654(-)
MDTSRSGDKPWLAVTPRLRPSFVTSARTAGSGPKRPKRSPLLSFAEYFTPDLPGTMDAERSICGSFSQSWDLYTAAASTSLTADWETVDPRLKVLPCLSVYTAAPFQPELPKAPVKRTPFRRPCLRETWAWVIGAGAGAGASAPDVGKSSGTFKMAMPKTTPSAKTSRYATSGEAEADEAMSRAGERPQAAMGRMEPEAGNTPWPP